MCRVVVLSRPAVRICEQPDGLTNHRFKCLAAAANLLSRRPVVELSKDWMRHRVAAYAHAGGRHGAQLSSGHHQIFRQPDLCHRSNCVGLFLAQ